MTTQRLALMVCGFVALAGCNRSRSSRIDLTSSHAAAIRDSVRGALRDYQRLAAAAQWDSVAVLYSADADARWIEDGKRSDAATIRKGLASLHGTRVATTYDRTEILPLAPGLASL